MLQLKFCLKTIGGCLGQILRDRDEHWRYETKIFSIKSRLECAETEIRHETFETNKCLQNFTEFFKIKFWAMDILINFRIFCNRPRFFYTPYNFVCFCFGVKMLTVQKRNFSVWKKCRSKLLNAYQLPRLGLL